MRSTLLKMFLVPAVAAAAAFASQTASAERGERPVQLLGNGQDLPRRHL